MSVAAKDLVILIDGLDEVPSDRFIEMLNHIKDFSVAHEIVHLCFSCRKLFFADYDLEGALPKFDFFELQELGYGQSFRYMENELGSERESFFRRIQLLNPSCVKTG